MGTCGCGSQTLSLLSETLNYIRLTDLARVPDTGVCCDDQWTCVHVRVRRGAPTSLSCAGACQAAICMLHFLMSSHALAPCPSSSYSDVPSVCPQRLLYEDVHSEVFCVHFVLLRHILSMEFYSLTGMRNEGEDSC